MAIKIAGRNDVGNAWPPRPTRRGSGADERGGVRVIRFDRLESGEIWLLAIYAKAIRGNIPAHLLKAIKETIEHD